jgi:hypothetical protein
MSSSSPSASRQGGLHRGLAEITSVPNIMRPLFIVFADPQVQIGLQLIDERYTFADDLPQGFRTMHYVRDWLPI